MAGRSSTFEREPIPTVDVSAITSRCTRSKGSSNGSAGLRTASDSSSRAECCSPPLTNGVPPRDVDLASLELDNAIEAVEEVIVEIASIEIDDGLTIATDHATAAPIREESAGYTGVRISLPAKLASARVNFHVDVNVGDPIEPAPERITLHVLCQSGQR